VLKNFSFWMVVILLGSIGSMVFIHGKTIRDFQQRIARIEPLYQRQKVLDEITLSLERYRRVSSNFRKLDPNEVAMAKTRLKNAFVQGVQQLDQLDPTSKEKVSENQLVEQVSELLKVSAQIEPTLFSQDAYYKPEVQSLHEGILSTLTGLEKSTQSRIELLRFDSSRMQAQSLVWLLGVGALILTLVFCMTLKNHFVYVRPLRKLHFYAISLGQGKRTEELPEYSGVYGEIQSVIYQLSRTVEIHVRDRHKFIMDIVTDLKEPLSLLQAGRDLIGDPRGLPLGDQQLNEEKERTAIHSVRRGLAIFSGSLDDLNDIADINRLESRLEEKTVDLCDLIMSAARTLVGSELGKRIAVSVPPIPVWVSVDAQRFERVFVQVLSKVLNTLPADGKVSVQVNPSMQGSLRGMEIVVQDLERLKSGRGSAAGPEQDILKHWISAHGLSMTLAHKILRVHGGSLSAAGVVGTSVSITLRLPQERIVSRGLISRPPGESPLLSAEGGHGARGLFVSKNAQSSEENPKGVSPRFGI